MTASRPIQMLFMCARVFLGSVFFVSVVVPAALLSACVFFTLWAPFLALEVFLITVAVRLANGPPRLMSGSLA